MKAEQRVNRSASRLSCVSTGVPAGCACRLCLQAVAQVNKSGTGQQMWHRSTKVDEASAVLEIRLEAPRPVDCLCLLVVSARAS
jgi:hypothetical protein